jgi:hypothetical protein
MAENHAIDRYRRWYRELLRFYSKPHRERFAESMEQTFHDVCRERANDGHGLLGFVLWMFVETAAGILRENGGVGLAQFLRIVSPVAFFAVAIAAWVQMQNAIAVNIAAGLDNQLRQLFFQPPLPTRPDMAEVWLWTSGACFLCGVIAAWRLLRTSQRKRLA